MESRPRTMKILSDVDDDVITHICGFLTIQSLLSFRQSSKHCFAITKLLVVWRNLFHDQILRLGYPFPPDALQTTDSDQLERMTRRAHSIASFWLSPHPARPRCRHLNTLTKGTGISEIRFLPGFECQRFVTVSKGIWSVVSCWELGLDTTTSGDVSHFNPRKLAEWCPRGVILTGLAVNSQTDAEGLLAVAINRGGSLSIEILALGPSSSGPDNTNALPYTLTCMQNIETNCAPMVFTGSILVLCDGVRETHMLNWKTASAAVLQRLPSLAEHPGFEYNKCLQAVLTDNYVFVVRARVFELYTRPRLLPPAVKPEDILRPIVEFSFGWIDAVSVTPQIITSATSSSDLPPSISIVLRSEVDDPWSSDTSGVDVYTLQPNLSLPYTPQPPRPNDTPDALADFLSDLHLDGTTSSNLPYIYPPSLVTSISQASNAGRRALHCPTILSGKFGTSIWVQPPRQARSRRDVGLAAYDVHSSQAQGIEDVYPLSEGVLDNEREDGRSQIRGPSDSEILVGALFPGPLHAMHKRHQHDIALPRDSAMESDEYGLRTVCTPSVEDAGGSRYWMSIDYAEEWGRVILGSSDGMVTFVEV